SLPLPHSPSFSPAPPTTAIYPLSLHDALPILRLRLHYKAARAAGVRPMRKNMQYKEQVTKLATVAKNINDQHSGYLDSLKKGYSEIERDDFLWHFLLQSGRTPLTFKGITESLKIKCTYF